MNRSKPVLNFGFLLALLIANSSARAQDTNTAVLAEPSCGVVSVLALSQVTGRPLSPNTRQNIIKSYSQATPSLAQVKAMAAESGFELQGVKTTLSALFENIK